MRESPLKWLYRRALLLLIPLIIALILIEIVLNFYTPVELPIWGLNDPHPILGYRMKPNFKGRQRAREYNVRLRTNSLGLRGAELAPQKPYTKRILILGDSFTFGHGVREDLTYAAVLQDLLNRAGGDTFQVINAGVMGYDNVQQLRYLKLAGANLQPSAVVLSIFPGNDLGDNLKNEQDRAGNLQMNRPSHFHWLSRSNLYWALKSFYSNIRNSRRASKGDAANLARVKLFYLPEFQAEWEPYFQVLDSLLADFRQLAIDQHFLPYVLIVPERLQIGSADQKFAFSMLDSTRWNFQQPMDLVQDLALKDGFPVHNLLPDFMSAAQAEKLYFKFDKHFNAQGHRLAAEVLFQRLRPLLADSAIPSASFR